MTPDDSSDVTVDGRQLRLTNLDKTLYPGSGTTKAEVVDYYARVAPTALAHLGGRPLSLRRAPDGIDGETFFEKNCPAHRPDWLRTVRVVGRRGSAIEFCVLDDRAGLVWLANLAALELHPYLHRADAPDVPTSVVFDLDPGPPAGRIEAATVALEIRDLLRALGRRSVVKTSGGKGIQLYMPLNTPVGYDRTTAFAHAVALLLERRRPEAVVSKMTKDLRTGRVLVDWSQNNAHKTTVGAYSLRIAERPTVSTPVRWGELEEAVAAGEPERLVFGPTEVLSRLEREGDLFAEAETLEQTLPDLDAA